jgi:hypothetical protein
MTSIDTTAPQFGAVANHGRTSSSEAPRRSRAPLAAVALAASLVGGIVGVAGTVVVPTLTRDAATEHALLLELIEQVEAAAGRDAVWKAMNPEPR